VLESSPTMLCEIAAEVGDRRFGLCLDIGHAALRGPDIPLAEWVERMKPYLRHIHLHNNYGVQDTHNDPGDGTIDVAAVIRIVTEALPEVTFTLESSRGRASVGWMKANGFL